MLNTKSAKINWYSKKHGITLISLVITIVILLILAGVAVSISVGDGSVTQHAQNATEQWNAKVDEEQLKIDEALGWLPGGTPSDLPEGWESSKVAEVYEEGTRKAPIPVGYTKSEITSEINADSPEDTIAGGLVVYQIPEGATVDWANNQITLSGETTPVNLQENVNQYVWIPVDDINDMVMCKKNGQEGVDGKTICELDYNVTTPNEITCKTHGFDTTGYDTTENVLAKTNLDTVGLAGRLYGTSSSTTDTAAPKIYTTSMDFTTTSQTFSANSGYREPDLVTDYDKDDATSGKTYMVDAGITDGTVATFKAQLNRDFIAMAKSVAKYGGFYISRYEPSYESDQVISKKNQKVLTAAASASGNYLAGNRWYGLYNKTLNNVEKGASVNSHMIWGCQYDQVIKFLGTEAQTGHNYQTTSQVVTGYTGDQDILNNIYDLEGNNREWTAQAFSTNGRVYRGSDCDLASLSDFYPASSRGSGYPTGTSNGYSTRPALYVK